MRDLSFYRCWYWVGVLEPIPHGYQGTAVQWKELEKWQAWNCKQFAYMKTLKSFVYHVRVLNWFYWILSICLPAMSNHGTREMLHLLVRGQGHVSQ